MSLVPASDSKQIHLPVPVVGPGRRQRRSGRVWKQYSTPLVVVVVAVAASLEAVLATMGRYSYP